MGRRIGGQAGAVGAMVIIFLPAFLVGMGLVVDVGALLAARAQLAAAADMGALAGVQDLDYDLLAEGLIVIQEGQAIADAQVWVRANLERQAFIDPETVTVTVTVLNTEGRSPDAPCPACPVTGRTLTQPTVCVLVRARSRLPFLPSLGAVTLTVHADASVVGRP